MDEGFPPLRVASFNGGLFDPARHEFLERHTVGDARLQQAIDMLARVGGEFVDYRDLSERHLGSIYEGLLEFRLCPLPGEEPDRGSGGWTVDLLTDKGERKSSGSYYTPGFVTRFMVEQAIGPAIDAALQGAAERGQEAQAEAVLALNVLDCSMGSGHFLVEAAEYIARRLVAEDLLPVDVRHTADALPASNGSTPAHSSPTGAPPALDELAYWKRRVAQSCIYGVDLNPLAVDLAKLSLWLATAARDRPLSFLDHHLRPGNALVGARLEDLTPAGVGRSRPHRARPLKSRQQAEASGQLSMLEETAFRQSMSRAVGSMWLIEESPADTIHDVKGQAALYETVRQEFTRQYGRLADLVTATRFGLQVDPSLWWPLADLAIGKGFARLPQFEAWLAEAAALAERHCFFHWEVEFPEVFFDRFGRPLGDRAGFDVVIGNPPYVRQEALTALKPYLEVGFSAYHGAADLYIYFYEQGLRLLQQSGRMAYISSGTFARSNSGAALRSMLPSSAQIETVVDFGENQPFDGAEMVRPSIVVLTKGVQESPFRSLFISDKVPSSLEHALDEQGIECDATALQQPEWVFQPSSGTRLFAKIMAAGRPLVEVVGGRLYRGVLTGLNEAFIVDAATRDSLVQADPKCAKVLRHALRGEDLRPWYQEDEGRWLIVFPSGWTHANIGTGLSEEAAWAELRDRFPAIAAHLCPFAEAARGRCDRGEFWWELRACNYYPAFDQRKIFWPDIAKLPRYSWDVEGNYINNKGYIIPSAPPWLLGVLQSRVLWYATSQLCQPLRLRAGLWQYQMFTQFTSRLPIPCLKAADRRFVGDLAMRITQQASARYNLHQQTRHRINSDLGAPGRALNQKLTAWWGLDFPTFRRELQKVYRRDISLGERDEWESWLAQRRAEHERLTAEIAGLEADLNARVYGLFDLTPAEVRIVEETTKYRYGEV